MVIHSTNQAIIFLINRSTKRYMYPLEVGKLIIIWIMSSHTLHTWPGGTPHICIRLQMCNNANVKSEKQLFHRRYKTREVPMDENGNTERYEYCRGWTLVETAGIGNIYHHTFILLGRGVGAHNTEPWLEAHNIPLQDGRTRLKRTSMVTKEYIQRVTTSIFGEKGPAG